MCAPRHLRLAAGAPRLLSRTVAFPLRLYGMRPSFAHLGGRPVDPVGQLPVGQLPDGLLASGLGGARPAGGLGGLLERV
ncbi:hypothetical protein OG320_10970 [Microbispora sp. NBC_01189]|uniref:hypothetical protein n=1 Tax=Microbispora sp. NBC_01189 TaxID=2903583 RepID=UPI002E135139|nr:hypothetical protein OG320_10970 [Microbispora sp. NBC_01189]